MAQVFCPVVFQWFSTPIHVAGLTVYKNPEMSGPKLIQKTVEKTPAAIPIRKARVFVAFGAGGVVNRIIKERILGLLHRFDRPKN